MIENDPVVKKIIYIIKISRTSTVDQIDKHNHENYSEEITKTLGNCYTLQNDNFWKKNNEFCHLKVVNFF